MATQPIINTRSIEELFIARANHVKKSFLAINEAYNKSYIIIAEKASPKLPHCYRFCSKRHAPHSGTQYIEDDRRLL